MSGRSWTIVVALVGTLLGLLLLAERCEAPPAGGGRDGDYFDAARPGGR